MQQNSLMCCGGGRRRGGGSGWRGYCHVVKTANIVNRNVESFNTDCAYTKTAINTESTVFCHQLIEGFMEYSRIPRINTYSYLIRAKSVKANLMCDRSSYI